MNIYSKYLEYLRQLPSPATAACRMEAEVLRIPEKHRTQTHKAQLEAARAILDGERPQSPLALPLAARHTTAGDTHNGR